MPGPATMIGRLGLGALLIAAGLAWACEDPGPLPRCQALVDWLALCEPSCPGSKCDADGEGPEVLGLDALDASALADFDACMLCLTSEADQGRCTDCQIQGRAESCREMLQSITGLSCPEL